MNSHSPYRSHVCGATINHDRSWKATGLPCHSQSLAMKILCDQLNNTTSLSDLSLCLLAEPTRAHYQGDGWDSAFAENFAVAEGEEIEDGDGILLAAGEVFITLLGGDEGPEL